MIDLEIVKEPICHALGKNEVQPESSIHLAYKIDSGKKIGSNITVNEGLCSLVGFSPSDFKQADYFLLDEINNNAQIIELSDLSSDYKDCMKATKDFDNEDLTYAQMILKNKDKAKDFVHTKIWSEVISEFKNKWFGSIAIIERYCRKINFSNDLSYSFLIVLKNSQDPYELEIISRKLKGMVRHQIKVVNTKNLDKSLLIKIS